jgi:hypothetical protein
MSMPKHIMAKDELLHIYSMRKRLRIYAIFTNAADANDYMAKHDNLAVVACFGNFIFLADQYDKGE